MKSTPPIDVLLASLRHIAQKHDRKLDIDACVANLPMPPEGVTPALFPRVAARAGFSANFKKESFSQLELSQSATVLLLEGNRVGLLLAGAGHDAIEFFLLDDGGQLVSVSKKELQQQYAGFAFVLTHVGNAGVPDGAADLDHTEQRRQWFWLTLWRYRTYYLQIIPASFLVNMFALAMPFFVMIVYDKVVPNNAVETLWVLAIGVTMVFLFDLMIRIVRGALLERAGREMDFELAGTLFEQLLSLSMRAMPVSAGQLVNRVKAYETLREFFVSATMLAIVDLPFSVLMIGVIFVVAGPIGWILLLAVVLGFVFNILLQWPLRKAVNSAAVSGHERQSLIAECVGSLESVKAYNAEGYLQRKMNTLLRTSSLHGVKSHWYALLGSSTTTTLINLTSVMVIVAGVYRVNAGLLSMGGLIATVMLTSRCMAPLAMVSGLMTRLQQTMQSLSSLNDVMSMERDIEHRKEYLSNPGFVPQFKFNQVSLAYEGYPEPAIKEIDLGVSAGESIVLLGKIGCGKSSLLKLMAGMLQPSSGALLVDGIEASQYHPATLRSRLGYVPQDAALFHGTLRENVVLGDATISDDQIMQSIVKVGLGEYVQRHQHGVNAQVGERGCLLSGGQRRAVALARCLVRDYPILLLDEPTANLDPQTEKAVIQTLRELRLKQNIALIIATHKPSVIDLADRAIVMENGKIVADGPPASVLGLDRKKQQSRFKVTNKPSVAETA